jgi:hypothetical protein
MISYQNRITFLQTIQSKGDGKQIYSILENETSLLSELKSGAIDIYKLIKKKE